jgi:hypothetical protein
MSHVEHHVQELKRHIKKTGRLTQTSHFRWGGGGGDYTVWIYLLPFCVSSEVFVNASARHTTLVVYTFLRMARDLNTNTSIGLVMNKWYV